LERPAELTFAGAPAMGRVSVIIITPSYKLLSLRFRL
jgi:hypothetical protein